MKMLGEDQRKVEVVYLEAFLHQSWDYHDDLSNFGTIFLQEYAHWKTIKFTAIKAKSSSAVILQNLTKKLFCRFSFFL